VSASLLVDYHVFDPGPQAREDRERDERERAHDGSIEARDQKTVTRPGDQGPQCPLVERLRRPGQLGQQAGNRHHKLVVDVLRYLDGNLHVGDSTDGRGHCRTGRHRHDAPIP
jgi:hypothetical protein